MTTSLEQGWIPDGTSFSARLALIRNARHWNVKEAASAAGVPAQSWRNWEQGSRPQGMDEIIDRIASAIGVDRYWLMCGDTTPRGGPSSIPASSAASFGVFPYRRASDAICLAA